MKRFNKFYLKTLLAIAVLGPVFWMLFSEDGQRYYDVFVLKLMNGPEMNIEVTRLQRDITEEELQRALPDLPFQCADHKSDLGSRVCETPIAAFNGAPSVHAAFYFGPYGLQAMKVLYQRAYHRALRDYLQSALGAPRPPQHSEATIDRWDAGGGEVIMLNVERLESDQEPALLWLARR